jgi:hypothetical protein
MACARTWRHKVSFGESSPIHIRSAHVMHVNRLPMWLRIEWCKLHVRSTLGSTRNVKTSLRLFCVFIGLFYIRSLRSHKTYIQMSGMIWAFRIYIKHHDANYPTRDIACNGFFQPCVLWRWLAQVEKQKYSDWAEELIPSVVFDADSEYVSVGLVRSMVSRENRSQKWPLLLDDNFPTKPLTPWQNRLHQSTERTGYSIQREDESRPSSPSQVGSDLENALEPVHARLGVVRQGCLANIIRPNWGADT